MADHIPGTPPCRQPIFFSPENTLKTEQYRSWGNAVVPANQELESVAAFTILTFTEDPFKIKKLLTKSDVDGSSRLLLQKQWVEEHILPSMDPRDAQLCRTTSGKLFPVVDHNDDSLHYLILKKWTNTYFVFTKNWVPNFVTRKSLEAGDLIGLAFFNGRFFFKLLKKKAN